MALPARRPETIVLAERWLVKCEGVFSRFVPIAHHARGAMGESSAQSLQWRNHAPGISLPGAAGVKYLEQSAHLPMLEEPLTYANALREFFTG